MVEMALVLPILLIILCGIIDFGWIYYNTLAVANSTREGARYAVVNTAPKTGDTSTLQRDNRIKAKILDVSPATIKTNMVITITYSDTTTPINGDVSVTVTSNLRILTPVVGLFYTGQVKPVTSKVVMKVES